MVTGSYLEGYNAHSASGASRMDLAIEDILQSVSVITSAQLQDFQLTDVNLALDSAYIIKKGHRRLVLNLHRPILRRAETL